MISVLTEHFVTMFVSSKSRTVDQMQQAASASRCAEPESTIEIITKRENRRVRCYNGRNRNYRNYKNFYLVNLINSINSIILITPIPQLSNFN